jgi:hypothetical protein
LNNSQRKNGKS